jgi:hypothetical protein
LKECYKKIVSFLPSWAMFVKICKSSLVIKTFPIEWGSSWTSPSFIIGHVIRGSTGFCILKWVNVQLHSYFTSKKINWTIFVESIGSMKMTLNHDIMKILHRLTIFHKADVICSNITKNKIEKKKFHPCLFVWEGRWNEIKYNPTHLKRIWKHSK